MKKSHYSLFLALMTFFVMASDSYAQRVDRSRRNGSTVDRSRPGTGSIDRSSRRNEARNRNRSTVNRDRGSRTNPGRINRPAPDRRRGPVVTRPAPDRRRGPVVTRPAPDRRRGPVVTRPAPDRRRGPVVTRPTPDRRRGPVVNPRGPYRGGYHHSPYRNHRRHNQLRFRNSYNYWQHVARSYNQYVYRNWIFYPSNRFNGFTYINGYPFFIYNGLRHRYSNFDYCSYELVDRYSYQVINRFYNYTCAQGYDSCAYERDYLNQQAWDYRYACVENYRNY